MKRMNFIVKRKRIRLPSVRLSSFSLPSFFLPLKNILKLPVPNVRTLGITAGMAFAFLVSGHFPHGHFVAGQPPAAEPQLTLENKPDPTAQFATTLAKEFEAKHIAGLETLERESDSKAIRVTLNSDQFFQFGTANLESKAEPYLKEIAELLKVANANSNAKSTVEIEGHTDDTPVVRQKRLYRSNWELSIARAMSLVHVFEEAGFSKETLKVSGYGDSRPLLPNHTLTGESIATNLIKNRRIVLRIFPNFGAQVTETGGTAKSL